MRNTSSLPDDEGEEVQGHRENPTQQDHNKCQFGREVGGCRDHRHADSSATVTDRLSGSPSAAILTPPSMMPPEALDTSLLPRCSQERSIVTF